MASKSRQSSLQAPSKSPDLKAAEEHIAKLERALSTARADITTALGSALVFTDRGEEGEGAVEARGVRLVAVPELSYKASGDGKSPHLIVEGDNLHSLALLGDGYAGKVDVIYIDPPYNTGNTGFRYSDKFQKAQDRHSGWLSFMRRRLLLARELLAESGVIFISIDDREYAHLKLLCDEVFLERNYIGTIVWHSKYTVSNDAKHLSRQHEYILAYGRDKKNVQFGRLPRTAKSNAAYRNQDNDPRGPWKATPIHAKSGTEARSYTIKFPNGTTWTAPAGRFPRFRKQRLLEMYSEGRLWFGADGKAGPSAKTYLSEVGGIVSGSLFEHELVGHTHGANEQLSLILGKGVFDNPKPVELITTLIKLGSTKKNAIVLDFFAGSGTTAHAVALLNNEDGGTRQAVLCTNNENDICRKVTYARLKAVLSGEYPTGHNESPLPGEIRYYLVAANPETRSSDEAALSVRLGYHDVTQKLGHRKLIELRSGKKAVLLARSASPTVVKKIQDLRETSAIAVYARDDVRKALLSAGLTNVKVLT